MSLKSQIEAIIYAAEEPVTLEQMLAVLKDDLRSFAENGAEPDPAQMKATLRAALDELSTDYAAGDRGMEIRQVAGGYRMSTKPEHHDVVRGFARNLKPPVRLSLPALETLAVIAYKQPITVPEISEIRGVDSGGVIATLLDRKLITTAGRKQVVGRPILYRTTKDFLLRFGLGDIGELPSMEEFEKLAAASLQVDMFEPATPVADATGVPDVAPEPATATESAAEPERRTVVELGEPHAAEVTTADS
ncbi:MAG TPA: SMC-Scp complex subunit ScpB [Terriglobales bacterium]|nr:SMC-Scp complex subunit ScpB [Terriglobales bacterium]